MSLTGALLCPSRAPKSREKTTFCDSPGFAGTGMSLQVGPKRRPVRNPAKCYVPHGRLQQSAMSLTGASPSRAPKCYVPHGRPLCAMSLTGAPFATRRDSLVRECPYRSVPNGVPSVTQQSAMSLTGVPLVRECPYRSVPNGVPSVTQQSAMSLTGVSLTGATHGRHSRAPLTGASSRAPPHGRLCSYVPHGRLCSLGIRWTASPQKATMR